ncbi:MAG TPA: hypothetical protein VK151_08695 [Fluviicola sp.]|nr:hypothetical protein [Fluviicola sp.]
MKQFIESILLILIAVCSAGCSETGRGKALMKTPVQNPVNIIYPVKKDSIRISECYYTDLSDAFNYRILYKCFYADSSSTDVYIIDKKRGKIVDSIHFESVELAIDGLFFDCKKGYSYLGDKNRIPEVQDNYAGEFIIADFNFDLKEDIAVIQYIGGNGGPQYRYYVQGQNQRFKLDDFLTDWMSYFPVEFDPKKKTLLTSVHANAYSEWRTIYQYSGSGKWKSRSDGYLFCGENERIVRDPQELDSLIRAAQEL